MNKNNSEYEKLYDMPILTRETVYKLLKHDVIWGKFPPDSRLTESRLAKFYGTSRTPIREALHLLESEGLIKSIRRFGYQIESINPNDVEEICELRIVNETFAAQRAMKYINDEDIRSLKNNLKQMENLIKHNDPDEFIRVDAEFHEILFRASKSKRLMEFCKLIRQYMLRYLIASMGPPEAWKKTLIGHQEIANALIKQDEKRLKIAIKNHLTMAKNDIFKYLFNK